MLKRGYDTIPDEGGRYETAPASLLRRFGLPVLGALVVILAIIVAVLAWSLYDHVRDHNLSTTSNATAPVVRGYFVSFDLSAQAANNWANRSSTLASYYAYLQSLATSQPGPVYLNASNPLQLSFNHGTGQVYNAIFQEQYYDTPNKAITMAGGSLRVRTYLSASGNGSQMAGTAVVEYIYRNADYMLAINSGIAPGPSQTGKQRIEYVYNTVSEYVSPISRYEHRISVSSIPSTFVPTSMSSIYSLFSGLQNVLPNVPGSLSLSVSLDRYVWEQSYYHNSIGPSNTQTMETKIELYYSSLAGAQSGNVLPILGRSVFELWAGNNGFGKSSLAATDQAMTLFWTINQSPWHTTPQ